MKQTAVEWLIEQLEPNIMWMHKARETVEQAKEMEKQQIIDAVDETISEMNLYESYRTLQNGKQYYNKTFKSE